MSSIDPLRDSIDHTPLLLDRTAEAPAPASVDPALRLQPAPVPPRLLLVEMWDETREIFKAITTDVLIFLLAIGGLFICYLVLHEIEKAGYPHEKVARFEELHFWAYLAVTGLFAADLIVKLFVFLFLRRRGEQ